jgi:inhibitor of KinA
MQPVRFLSQGECGLVVEFGNDIDSQINSRVHFLANRFRKDAISGIKALVPTYRSLLILFDPLQIDRAKICRLTEAFLTEEPISGRAAAVDDRVVIIPACYGQEYGPDIQFVADHNSLTVDEVIRIHTSTAYKIYMMGFTPGFPYLGGMSSQIVAPRLDTPRTIIPAGSVGIAGAQTGLYPVESPGGWRLIGRTPLRVFDVLRDPAFIYGAGDYLKFESISEKEFLSIQQAVETGTYSPKILKGSEVECK